MASYIGEIRFWAGPVSKMPSGWMPLDFTRLSTVGYEVLAQLLGANPDIYLPDARARTPVGEPFPYDPINGTGSETVTLQVPHLPSHNHPAGVSGSSPSISSASGNLLGTGASVSLFNSGAPSLNMASSTLGSVGLGVPHSNIPPYLAVVLMIRVAGGIAPVAGSCVGGAFTNLGGMFQFFCFSGLLPAGLLNTDGSALLQSVFTGLFSLIGTTFGLGSDVGVTTFSLPNTIGRAINGAGTGTYSGASTYSVGDQTGEGSHTLGTLEIPAHVHTFTAASDLPDSAFTAANFIASSASTNFFTPTVDGSSMASAAIGNIGGGLPHANWPPFIPITILIAADEPDDPLFDTGTIVCGPWAAGSPPTGMLFCGGSSVSTTTYAALFAIIGYTYGGSGATFDLPDSRGRIMFHISAPNLPTGLSEYDLGQTGGSETVTLIPDNLPRHSHPWLAGAGVASSATPSGNVIGAGTRGHFTANFKTAATATQVLMNADACRTAGGGGAHENRPPQLAMNFFIVY